MRNRCSIWGALYSWAVWHAPYICI